MNTPLLPSNGLALVCSTDIRALVKEKIRFRAKRYQRGSLTVWKRKTRPDGWMFRYYFE